MHGTGVIVSCISLDINVPKTASKNNIQFLIGYSLRVVKLINPL
jgi:hypothetical protein